MNTATINGIDHDSAKPKSKVAQDINPGNISKKREPLLIQGFEKSPARERLR